MEEKKGRKRDRERERKREREEEEKETHGMARKFVTLMPQISDSPQSKSLRETKSNARGGDIVTSIILDGHVCRR